MVGMTSPQPALSPGPPPPPPAPTPPPLAGGPWNRSTSDRVVAGVCGGIGRRLGVDPVILRVVVVVLTFFAGSGLVLYAAAWLFLPADQTSKSVLTDALSSTSTDRTRSVLTAVGLAGVLAIAALVALDGGFVPGLLIAIVVVAALLVVRRDENPVAPPGQPVYGPPSAGLAVTTVAPYASTRAGTEPTVVTGSGAEPTVELGTRAGQPAGAVDPTLTMQRPSPTGAPAPVTSPMTAQWDPPFDQPPPPPYGSGQLPPPKPRRKRSYLGLLTLSAMLAVLGVLALVDLSGVAVPIASYVVAALAVVACGLVLGAWIGRSRGLIALGILLGLALGPAVLADAVVGPDWRDWRNADDIGAAPRTPDELSPAYEFGTGSIRLDLTELDFEGEDLATMIDLGAGEVIVTVPDDVDVVADAAVGLGDLIIFDRRSSGFEPGDAFTDLGTDGAGGGRLELSIDLGLGKVEVRRATS